MSGLWARSLTGLAVAGVAGLALLIGGCGNDDSDIVRDDNQAPQSTSEPDDGGGASLSSVAPNTFLTFEGERYRLVDLEQANLVDGGAFEEIGQATDADIDQDDLTVYRRSGDADAVYTYGEAAPESEVGEDNTTPALWYRWVPEP